MEREPRLRINRKTGARRITAGEAHEDVLRLFRARARERRYVLTLHAAEELEADGFTILDLESGVLTGAIVERQREPTSRERKYRIRGSTPSAAGIELVAKMGPTGRMVVLTVYAP